MQIENWNINDVKPFNNNARVHEEKSISAIKASVDRFDWLSPICVDSDGVIIAGHGRWEAAKQLGLTEVPVLVADWLSDNEVAAAREADNMTQDLSYFDWDALNINLGEIDWLDIDMTEFGFKLDDELTAPEVDEDDYTEDQADEAPSRVAKGDIWQLGEHRLMCGDSTSQNDVETLMGGVKADMVFTDPPYNVAIGSKNAFLNTVQPSGRCCDDIAGDKGMTDEEIGETLWKPAFSNMRDNANDCCSIYVTMPQGGSHMMMMMMMMMSASWQVKHELIWVKNAPTFSMGRLDYDYQHEPICYGWNKSHVFYGKGEQNKSIWNYDKPRENKLHPTMKPIALIENALQNSSKEQDAIMDLFGGSGSTLIACEQLNRKCYMMELDPHYCDVIIDRWENLTGNKAVKTN